MPSRYQPPQEPSSSRHLLAGAFELDYTFYLNALALGLSAFLFWAYNPGRYLGAIGR